MATPRDERRPLGLGYIVDGFANVTAAKFNPALKAMVSIGCCAPEMAGFTESRTASITTSGTPITIRKLPARFNAHDMAGKLECKRALLDKFFLPQELDRPIFASVTRLTSQKGFELIQQVAGEILATGAFFIALGSGDKTHERFLQALHDAAPDQVGVFYRL